MYWGVIIIYSFTTCDTYVTVNKHVLSVSTDKQIDITIFSTGITAYNVLGF